MMVMKVGGINASENEQLQIYSSSWGVREGMNVHRGEINRKLVLFPCKVFFSVIKLRSGL